MRVQCVCVCVLAATAREKKTSKPVFVCATCGPSSVSATLHDGGSDLMEQTTFSALGLTARPLQHLTVCGSIIGDNEMRSTIFSDHEFKHLQCDFNEILVGSLCFKGSLF